MRVVFFGADTFGIPVLDALKKSAHELTGVVTTPDKPKGRGRKLTASVIKTWAQENGVPVLPVEDVNTDESLTLLRETGAEVFLVVSFGTILSEAFLNLPACGCLNVHPSLLPKYRGASPVAQALLEGDKVTGTTVLKVAPKLDAGDILLQESLALSGDENAAEVWARLAVLSAPLVVRALDAMASGESKSYPQDDAKATFCSKLKKEDGLIDWSKSAERIHNRVRAFSMWPTSVTSEAGRGLRVLRTHLDAQAPPPGKAPGTLLEVRDPDGMRVSCGEGSLWVLEVQPEGKRPMSYRDFVNGSRTEPGFVFG